MLEKDLYEPMCKWLEQYLKDHYKGYEIIVADTSLERLDKALQRYGVVNEQANGVDIQIDVLGIARKGTTTKLFFIEAKKTKLTLRDLGQLWAYCKLVDPRRSMVAYIKRYGKSKKAFARIQQGRLIRFRRWQKNKKDEGWNLGCKKADARF